MGPPIKKKYHLRSLDFYISGIGRDIESSKELDELNKDRECDFHMDPFLEGITNGQYVNAIYCIFKFLSSEDPKIEINLAQKAIFHNLHRNSISCFKDSFLDDWEFSEYGGIDCWNLYAVCASNQNLSLHSYRENPSPGKPLLTSLKNSEWDYIFQVIENEFFPDYDWMDEDHIEDLGDELLNPSDDQYEKALKWLFTTFENIWYNKSNIIKKIYSNPKPKKKRHIKKHDFFHFMHTIKEEMAHEYKMIRSRALEDPGTAGDQVEENWAQFLRDWLPSNYPVVTKGRLIETNGFSSPQVDVLVLNPSYPLSLRNKKYYFAAGVIAAFECKLTLKKEHFSKFFINSAIIKGMTDRRKGNPYDELNQLPYYGLLAVSHSWKDSEKAMEKLHDDLYDLTLKSCTHPREMPDLICVADACTFYLDKTVSIGPLASSDLTDEFEYFDKDGCVTTAYLCTHENSPEDINLNGEILARLIYDITNYMAFEDKSLRLFADYLSNIREWSGIGKIILWKKTILSREVGQTLIKKGYENIPWSKWTKHC